MQPKLALQVDLWPCISIHLSNELLSHRCQIHHDYTSWSSRALIQLFRRWSCINQEILYIKCHILPQSSICRTITSIKKCCLNSSRVHQRSLSRICPSSSGSFRRWHNSRTCQKNLSRNAPPSTRVGLQERLTRCCINSRRIYQKGIDRSWKPNQI